MVVCSKRDFEPRAIITSPKNKLCSAWVVVPKFLSRGFGSSGRLSCRLLRNEREHPVTVSSPNVTEIKLDRLIDDMRLLRSQMIEFDKHLKGIAAYLKPSEKQPKSKSRPWFAAAARATARTVTVLFAVGAATGAVLLYLGT